MGNLLRRRGENWAAEIRRQVSGFQAENGITERNSEIWKANTAADYSLGLVKNWNSRLEDRSPKRDA
jgi:hypothetical protein